MKQIGFVLAIACMGAGAASARDACVTTPDGKLVCGKASARDGSVYDGYGQSVFLRGGYVFIAHGDRTPNNANIPYFAAGYRRSFGPGSRFSFESEVVYHSDTETAVIGLGQADLSTLGIVALASVRWSGPELGWSTRTFASAGFGPSYYRSAVDDGATRLTDGEVGLGYSFRVGVERPIFDNFSLEAAYRYLNATNDAAVGLHAAELGLNYAF